MRWWTHPQTKVWRGQIATAPLTKIVKGAIVEMTNEQQIHCMKFTIKKKIEPLNTNWIAWVDCNDDPHHQNKLNKWDIDEQEQLEEEECPSEEDIDLEKMWH